MDEKYPRTFHLPWSPGASGDDKVMGSVAGLSSCGDLVVTEKMDGGNFTMTSERCYARSPSASAQPWDGMARSEWARVRLSVPPGWRVVGESLAACRSVQYSELPGPFLVFGVFDDRGTLLSWTETEEWAALLGLPTVPVLHLGDDLGLARGAWSRLHFNDQVSEGYVVRAARSLARSEFGSLVGKYVRAGHVQTSDDWRRRDDYRLNSWVRV